MPSLPFSINKKASILCGVAFMYAMRVGRFRLIAINSANCYK